MLKKRLICIMESLMLRPTTLENKLFSIKKLEGTRFPFPYHNHDSFELTYVIRGKGTRIINDNVDEFDSGDIVLLAPYVAHQWQSDSFKIKNVFAVCIYFNENFPTKDFQHLQEYKNILNLKQLAKRGVQLNGKLRDRVAKKIGAFEDLDGFGQIIQLLNILNEVSTSDEYDLISKTEVITKKTLTNERINQIMDHIFNNYMAKLSLETIADIACMHKASVGRYFKQVTGFTLVEYINLVRIGKICEQLKETDKNIHRIALECGYENLSHFNRCFRRLKDMTPRAYREKAQSFRKDAK